MTLVLGVSLWLVWCIQSLVRNEHCTTGSNRTLSNKSIASDTYSVALPSTDRAWLVGSDRCKVFQSSVEGDAGCVWQLFAQACSFDQRGRFHSCFTVCNQVKRAALMLFREQPSSLIPLSISSRCVSPEPFIGGDDILVIREKKDDQDMLLWSALFSVPRSTFDFLDPELVTLCPSLHDVNLRVYSWTELLDLLACAWWFAYCHSSGNHLMPTILHSIHNKFWIMSWLHFHLQVDKRAVVLIIFCDGELSVFSEHRHFKAVAVIGCLCAQ